MACAHAQVYKMSCSHEITLLLLPPVRVELYTRGHLVVMSRTTFAFTVVGNESAANAQGSIATLSEDRLG